ncbi:MAG: excinuclease ABC subunit UvrC [Bacilli bacterium]|nr:excinuclease ABC subunit UvrC [Bacilli bacterium]
MNDNLKNKIANLPTNAGCYLMKNTNNEIIYVGKAKNLKNRVSQYFTRPHAGKTQKMVSEVNDFDLTLTSSEKEALILEINLIHLHNPKYNIALKDDKSYPLVAIKMDRYPYLYVARNNKDKKSIYFGPYPNSSSCYEIINLANMLFPLRKCHKIPNKPCLYYDLKACLGPCIHQDLEYHNIVDDLIKFLKGNKKDIRESYRQKMMDASNNLEFEKANEYKKIIDSIDYITSKQNVQLKNNIDVDVFAYYVKEDYISLSTLVFRDGILINRINKVIDLYGDLDSLISSYILNFYENNVRPKEIIVPHNNDINILEEIMNISFVVPKKGDKLELLKLAQINAKKEMEDKFAKPLESNNQELLDRLTKLLNINSLHQIDIIDNSHLGYKDAVSAVVVYINGMPYKKMYRLYNIDESIAFDDLRSMYHVINRRFSRIKKEKGQYCNLLIVDGGFNQLKEAKKALDELEINLPVIGLVKDDKHITRAIVIENGEEIDIKSDKELYFFLVKMQDEVHRFAISNNRKKRSKSLTSSVLDEVSGLGKKRKELLLSVYKSIDDIKNASDQELSIYLPKKVIENLREKLL